MTESGEKKQQDQSDAPPRRVIRRRRRNNQNEPPVVDPVLFEQVYKASSLPTAYSFELVKTVERIVQLKASHVALQMPEGLLLYATVLADVLQRLVPHEIIVSILANVTYGACCIDDLGAQALGADLLVHYGHSCLVPLQHTVIPCLYVFCEIQLDVPHLVGCVQATLKEQAATGEQSLAVDIYLLGTVQFRHALEQVKLLLGQHSPRESGSYTIESVSIPQVKPLSPGEVLGCTSPSIPKTNHKPIVIFVADGRFHLEATLLANPHLTEGLLRYDPYGKTLTIETYNHDKMKLWRQSAIGQAQAKLASKESPSTVVGILFGTLGRQGNPAILRRIRTVLRERNISSFVVLLSEITPRKLALLQQGRTKVDFWVQIACPRLSVDWGHNFEDGSIGSAAPVLSPYELFLSLGLTNGNNETTDNDTVQHPMDYYASTAAGPWSNYYGSNPEREAFEKLADSAECDCRSSGSDPGGCCQEEQ